MNIHRRLTPPPAWAYRNAPSAAKNRCTHPTKADCLTPIGVATWITARAWPTTTRSWRGNASPQRSGKHISGEDYLPFAAISNAALCEVLGKARNDAFHRLASGGFISPGTTQQRPESRISAYRERAFGAIGAGFLAHHRGRPGGNSPSLSSGYGDSSSEVSEAVIHA